MFKKITSKLQILFLLMQTPTIAGLATASLWTDLPQEEKRDETIAGEPGSAWNQAALGFQVVRDNEERDAIPQERRYEGKLVFSKKTKCVYKLDKSLALWSIVAVSPALLQQSAWYVNSVAGNDNGSGQLGDPLKTTEELSDRLSPNGGLYFPQQQVTINLYGDFTNNVLTLFMTGTLATQLVISGQVVSSAPITLAAGTTATNSATSTRGQLVTTAGSFAQNQRVRVTSGAALGAISYCTGQNGDAQHGFVKAFYRTSDGSTAFPAVGDTVVTDTLLTPLGRIAIRGSARGIGNLESTSVQPRDLLLNAMSLEGFGVTINPDQCTRNPGFTHTHGHPLFGLTYTNCQTLSGQHQYRGAFILLNGQVFQGGAAGILFSGFTNARFGPSCAIDNSLLAANSQPTSSQTGFTVMRFANDVEMVNGAGTAFNIGQGCQIIVVGRMWGASTPYATGFVLTTGAWAYTTAAANLTFPVTNAISATGQVTATFASIPFNYQRADCGFGLVSDTTAAVNTT